MDIKQTACAAIAAVTLSVGAASAATYTVDLSGNAGLTSPITYTNAGGSGISVTAAAFEFNDNTGALEGPLKLGQYSNGLGVCSDVDEGYCDENHEVDGLETDEMVRFTFDQTIKLLSVAFSYVDSNDDFAFKFFDPAGQYYNALDINNSGSYTFSQTWTGTQFGIGAQGWNDNFKIKSLTFDYVAPIPLPAGGILLLTALGGLGVAARRRKA